MGYFPLNLDLKARSSLSKIVMRMAVIKRSITAGHRFSTVVFDSWYFASRLVRFLERENKGWVTEAKNNRKIFVGEEWMRLKDYAASLNFRDMTACKVDENTYFMKSITTRMKNIGRVQVRVSRGQNAEKFFVTNMIEWKPKQIMEMYLRRWDIEIMHRENKQDGLGRIYQRVFAGIVSTTKLSPLCEPLLEISPIRSLGYHLKIGKVHPV